jgi:hypothetical protein
MKREHIEELYSEILERTIIYLFKIKDVFNKDLERFYYSFIEQDVEKLLELQNYSIFNVEIYEKIRKCYFVIIKYKEDQFYSNKEAKYKTIVESLYHNFKYVMESILFMIENTFLDEAI